MADITPTATPNVELLTDDRLLLRWRAEGSGAIGDYAREVRRGNPDWDRWRPQAIAGYEYLRWLARSMIVPT